MKFKVGDVVFVECPNVDLSKPYLRPRPHHCFAYIEKVIHYDQTYMVFIDGQGTWVLPESQLRATSIRIEQ